MKYAKLAAVAATIAFMPLAAMAQDATQPASAPAPAPAPAAPVITVGAGVTGNDGIAIGTVAQVTPEAVIIDTGANQIPLPNGAFGSDAKGLTLNITKAALDASYEQQMAELAAQMSEKLVSGTPVLTADALALGTIDTIDGENVVLTLADEKKLTLGKDVFALDGAGALMVRATMAQIEQAMAATPAPVQG